MITVIAATPSSPSSYIIVTLNRNVVTAAEHWLTISDAPLEQLFRRTDASILGLQKYSSLLPLRLSVRKKIVPITVCPQSPDDLIQKQKPCRRNQQTDNCTCRNKQCEITSCLLCPSALHFLRNDRAAACRKHRSQTDDQIDNGAYDIDGRQGVRIYKPCYKNRVYNGI